jgi:hypothetical protein
MTKQTPLRSSAACLLGMALLSAQITNAHNPSLPAVCTEAGTTIRTIAAFNMTGQDILNVGGMHQINANGSVNVCIGHNSCSVVDQWHFSQLQADRYCSELRASAQATYAYALVTGPQAYFLRDHHWLYTVSQGVYGQCRVCEKDSGSSY